MNEEQVRDLLIVSIIVGGIFVIFGSLYVWLYRRYRKQGWERFEQFMMSLERDRANYQFYTNGHPQVWSETTEHQIKRQIANQCMRLIGAPFPVPSPSCYLVRLNEDRKAVYVIFGDKPKFNFDWDSLVHYEDRVGKKKA